MENTIPSTSNNMPEGIVHNPSFFVIKSNFITAPARRFDMIDEQIFNHESIEKLRSPCIHGLREE
jgi:hypothetical protein